MTAIVAATERIGVIGDGVDDLQRALQPGPAVRLARPPQQRPGRLEHRHHGVGLPRRTTSVSTPTRSHARPLRAGRGVRRRRHQAVGQLGGRRRRRRPPERGLRRPRQDPPRRPRRRALPRPRTAQRAALAAGPAGLRAGRVVARTAAPSPPAGPRRSSPRTRRWRTRRSSTPTSRPAPRSRPGPRPAQGAPRASARSSARRRQRPRARGGVQRPDAAGVLPAAAQQPRRRRPHGVRPRRAVPAPRSWRRSATAACHSRSQLVLDIVAREDPTMRQLLPPARRRARAPRGRRHAGSGRRHDPGVGRAGRRRRLQRDAAVAAGRDRRRSSRRSCRSCARAGCSARSTQEARCATTSASSRPASQYAPRPAKETA